MSFLATVGSTVKGVLNGIKTSLMTIENPEYGIEIAKAKIKNGLKTIGKVFLYQFLSYAVVIVIVIAAAGFIFEIFAEFMNMDDPYDVEPESMVEWAEELGEDEIIEMQEMGASIHPQKIERYLEIEDNSYPYNAEIKVPVTTKVWHNGELVVDDRDYNDYTLLRRSKTYKYRQWWQSTAGIDAINETSLHKNMWKIVDRAEEKLKPKFKWFNPMVGEMEDGDKYTEGSGPETVITTTTQEITRTLSSDGGDSSTDVLVTETVECYPLVELEEVETMFAIHTFEYESYEDIKSEETSYSYEDISTSIEIDENGNEIEVTHIITTTVHTQITTKLESWELKDFGTGFVSTFYDFLDGNNIDTNSDPEVIYLMAELFPQNQDFLSQYEPYLNFTNDMSLYGEFRGGFGGYEGQYEILPSDLVRDIPLFIQTDPRWANVPYSYSNNPKHGTIGTSACGPTSAAMLITGLGGYNESMDLNGDGIIDPYEATMYSLKKGHRVYGQGTSWGYFADIGKATGLKVSQKTPREYKDVLDALKKGNPVVASMGPGAFTRGGHYITLIGINEGGRIMVNDPNSVSRSNVAWDFYNPILAQAKQFWIFSK